MINHYYKTYITLLIGALVLFSCNKGKEQPALETVINNALSSAEKQYTLMAEKYIDQDSILPRSFVNGEMTTSDSRWWTSGFFPGSLWYLYEANREEDMLTYAKNYTARIEREKYTTDNHDVGFMLYCSFGNGLRLTGDNTYRDVLRIGAQSLATRYNPQVGLIRSWDFDEHKWQYPVIIDNMMNLELLLWASKAFNDPSLKELSLSHADLTMKHHYREDMSCYHVVSYDTITGLPHAKQTHQGYANESTWTRGQAWGLYGYTYMYRETGEKKYLDFAEKIASYLINHPHMPEDYIPYWDFDDPAIPNALRDVSAATVMASALTELSLYVDEKTSNDYRKIVEKQIRTLASPQYTAAIGENGNFILKHSVGSLPFQSEVDVPLTYADYYYLETLIRYKNWILNKDREDSNNPEELIFQNGFEGNSQVVSNVDASGLITSGFATDKIIGRDNMLTEKSDWGTDMYANPDAGEFLLEYTGGDETQRYAKIIPEPGNPDNKVLHFWLKDSWLASENQVKARIQANIYGIRNPYKEFYQSVRVFLHEDFKALTKYPESIGWLTISEFWNNEWWVEGEKYGFRIGLGMGKPTGEESELNFLLNAEDMGQIEVWRAHNTDVKVPIGKWFTLEYYFKEGNKENGRFYVAITPEGGSKQVVFDVNDFTHNTSDPAPNGLSGYNPMKLYTSKEIVAFMKAQNKALQIYWDDWKIWRNKRPSIY